MKDKVKVSQNETIGGLTDDPNTDDPNTDDPNTDDPNTDDPNTDDANTDDAVVTDALPDFLCDVDVTAAARVVELDRVRRDLVRWAAAAFVVRHPEAVSYRGHKGLLAAEQDMDFHVRHLRDAAANGSVEALRGYAPWIAQVFAKRGVSNEHVGSSIDALCEALLRFAAWPHGDSLAADLAGAFERSSGRTSPPQ